MREFAEWIAYNRLEPFGDERADWRVAHAAAAALNRSGLVSQAVQPKDLVLPITRPKDAALSMTQEERDAAILREVNRMKAMCGAIGQRGSS